MSSDNELPEWPTMNDTDMLLNRILSAPQHDFLQSEEVFNFYSKPGILKPDGAINKILFVGGLGSCTLSWRPIARYLSEKYNCEIHCVTLGGHDGSWNSVVNSTPDLWINSLTDYIQKNQLKGCACVCHSSGFLPACIILNSQPDIFSNLCAIGAPLYIAKPFFRSRVLLATFIDKITKLLTLGRASFLKVLRIKMGEALGENINPSEKLNVTYSILPGSTIRTMYDCQKETLNLLRLNHKIWSSKINFFYGARDSVVNVKMALDFLKSLNYQTHAIQNAGHSAQLAPNWQETAEQVYLEICAK